MEDTLESNHELFTGNCGIIGAELYISGPIGACFYKAMKFSLKPGWDIDFSSNVLKTWRVEH
jgi:hypothetical protein